MIVYFVRHGETAFNRDGLGLGRRDEPLTEFGARQAAAVGARFASVPLDAIYSSPLARCSAVARALAGERGIPIAARDELIEMDVGETEGLTFAAIRERHAAFLKQWGGPEGHTVPMPGGESILDVEKRATAFLGDLAGQGHQSVAVVSHNFVTRILLCRLLGLGPAAFRALSVDLASVSTVQMREGRVTVRSINDCCHLHALVP